MSLVCAQCSRVNPADAAYCYYDGAALAGRAGGPINAGAAPFPNPFVFPTGVSCRNFDQLASACQQNWSAAVDLLKQGFLGSFFGGIGRVDLAMAAQDAAKFPDLERGLDQLIAKLPTQAVQPPKLQAEPSEINLGLVRVGEDRATELHLSNLGMRLLYGTVTSDSKWLTLGDAPGHPEKLFQFGAETIIPVQVRGQHLRAGSKPLAGQLTLDSNGGTMTVTFRADVPITPYEGGMFAGALTPRQVAEKAKAKPKEATPYFETGAVAKWYGVNGWVYPVVGPTMPGVGGIQQFFEALGVAKSPKVDFSIKTLDLQGAVGKTIETTIDVTTNERKVVYGWATSDEPWVEVGKTKLHGKTATIPITIRVPDPCPPTLETKLHLIGNGNQKADIPVKIKVVGGKTGVKLERPQEFVALEIIDDDAPVVATMADDDGTTPVQFVEDAAPTAAVAPPLDDDASPFAIDDGPTKSTLAPASSSGSKLAQSPAGLALPLRLGMHLLPVGLLGLCVLVLIVIDLFSSPPPHQGGGVEADDVDPRPYIMVKFDEGLIGEEYADTMTFAVHKIDPANPMAGSTRLNWYPNGSGNSTVLMIDGKEGVFGLIPGKGIWARGFEKAGKAIGKYEGGRTRTFEFTKEGILVTQTVTIVPSDPVEVAPGDYKRLLTMCLVRFKIHNDDTRTHKVGLRFLMDTCIGDDDGVPFNIAGVNKLVTDKKLLTGSDVPGFIQVLEKPSLRDPGIVMQLNLRISDKIEPPEKFLLTHYPGLPGGLYRKWNVKYENFEDDSCVVMYWEPKELGPKKSREIGFTYGLGNISAEADKLGLTVGGSFQVGGELTVVALVSDRAAKTVTLKLPAGMSLLDKETLTQPVPPIRADRAAPVTWRVRAGAAGRHEISVATDTGAQQARRIILTDRSLFN